MFCQTDQSFRRSILAFNRVAVRHP
ncbi:hypothetical protein DXZ20_30525, partial [Leptolyngbyaceae cyanobacterium CCMR0081]|nr:hypothetical protein [Adonisia turfae CCMR0081]